MDVTTIINHLPVVLNQLTWLMIRISSEEVAVNVTKVLIHIVHQVHQVNKAAILDAYLQYVPLPPDAALKATVHEEMVSIVNWWNESIVPNETAYDILLLFL